MTARNIGFSMLVLLVAPAQAATKRSQPPPVDLNLFEDLPELTRALRSQNTVIRRDAVPYLEAYPLDKAAPLVIESLADADPEVERAAIEVAEARCMVGATPRLVQLSQSASDGVRGDALVALGRCALAEPADVAVIFRGLQDQSPLVRHGALTAIAIFAAQLSELQRVQVARVLDDEHPDVRAAALEVARVIAAQKQLALPAWGLALSRRLYDPVTENRVAAVALLARFDAANTAHLILPMLRDRQAEVRTATLLGLMHQRAVIAVPLLLDLIPTAPDDEVVTIAVALTALRPLATPALQQRIDAALASLAQSSIAPRNRAAAVAKFFQPPAR